MPHRAGYLILSDLHLSAGRNPVTGGVCRNEDFFFDEEFSEFLHHHMSSQWVDTDWTLIINGDFADFLQVTLLPEEPSDYAYESAYGLKAGARETVWKLKRIAEGHESVFKTLAQFATKHQVVIVLGNHDIEFHYQEVREAFLSRLLAYVTEQDRQRVRDNLGWRSWFFFDGAVYVEHGHQYDALNSFEHILDPRLPVKKGLAQNEENHIDLPLGSLFVRYLFNKVETETPYADNIKPATRFLSWFLMNHPFRALQFIVTDGLMLLRQVQRAWRYVPESEYEARRASHNQGLDSMAEALHQSLPVLDAFGWKRKLSDLDSLKVCSILRSPGQFGWRLVRFLTGPFRTLLVSTLLLSVAMCGLLVTLAPLLTSALPSWIVEQLNSVPAFSSDFFHLLVEVIRWLFLMQVLLTLAWVRWSRRPPSQAQEFRSKAESIRKLLKPQIIALGHTHDPGLMKLDQDCEYYNTGSWTRVFSYEAEMLREEKELTFLRVVQPDGKLKAKLLKWESGKKEARLAYLFSKAQ